MASKNAIKQYVSGGYYHIYNRGVEKRDIFMGSQDYGVFLGYLKEYFTFKDIEGLQNRLSDPKTNYKEKDDILKTLRLNNFFEEINLLAYSLMPNHFHLLIKQKDALSIDKFMNSIGVRFTAYINRKYKRVGTLFQDVYKAVLVSTDEQLLQLSKYIHKQSLAQPSSYEEYLGLRKTKWVQPQEILGYFSKANPSLNYKKFVEEPQEIELISKLLIDPDD